MRKKFIFSTGTGRCGTTSAKEVLNTQENSHISRECNNLPYIHCPIQIKNYIKEIGKRDAKFVGDSAFYITPHVPYIIKLLGEDIRIIYLYRICSEQVPSLFKHWKNRNSSTAENYARRQGIDLGEKNRFFDCYKKYNLPKYLALWWRCSELHAMAHEWEKRYYDNFRIVYYKDFLNDMWLQEYWLKWLGFENPSVMQVRKNVG